MLPIYPGLSFSIELASKIVNPIYLGWAYFLVKPAQIGCFTSQFITGLGCSNFVKFAILEGVSIFFKENNSSSKKKKERSAFQLVLFFIK